ncbi:MAG: cysteine-rich CWC family protein [Anaerolineales bacterium]|nr:cysteine-rich CWC family protein [Anaerolineales bacterium]
MGPDQHLDTSRCPLCGGPNRCALAADPSASECWCDSENIPRELLAQIPGNAVRRACICQKCLEQYRESTNIPDDSP